MRKILLAFFLFQTIGFAIPICRVGEIRDVKFAEKLTDEKIRNDKIYKSYILVDDKTDQILIEDNINVSYPIASITKLMTVMVFLDNIDKNTDLEKKIKIKKQIANLPYGVRLKENAMYSLIDLIYYTLMMSSNSSAKALADSVSKDFVLLMNKKAKSLGLENTSFCTAHGLPPKYTKTCLDVSSAYDVYKMTKYAIENYPLIAKITSTKYKNVGGINLINSNELLRTNNNIKGVKTGYHNLAGYNISILFDDGENKMYQVILGSDTEKNRKKISEIIFENR